MTGLDQYFSDDKQPWVEHPRFFHWMSKRDQGATFVVQIHRKRDGFQFGRTKIYARFAWPDGRSEMETEPWDDDLNEGLVEAGVKAKDLPNEALRFGFMLSSALRKAEIRFGDGFFNAVLLTSLKRSPFFDHEAVRTVLDEIHDSKPHVEGISYADCAEMIDLALRGRAKQLKKLGYETAEAGEILAQALAQYLDERFHVSSRKLLGL
ncbi:MAG: hypothetical protein HYV07_07645 [Deltaproteobacteria bacterium]|nr:hypothetical protein [Deltaproteobacteria bacterium]